MVFSDFHFYSEVLGIQTAVYVLMPDEKVMKQSKEPVPVLYLLHGLSDDHTMWMRQTMLEQHALKYRVCIVMPAVNRSFTSYALCPPTCSFLSRIVAPSSRFIPFSKAFFPYFL